MHLTQLSDQGEVIIPESIRTTRHWQAGLELVIIETPDGILLKPKKPFAETTLSEVAGCLRYQGTPKTLEDMEAAIAQGVKERLHDRD